MRSIARTVTTTRSLVASGGTTVNSKSVAVQVPVTGVVVYVGGADVTTANGFEVALGATISVDLTGDELWAVVASGTQTVRVLEENA
jgi:hypothetical protein